MILRFDSVEQVTDRISRGGKRYDCWVVKGLKKGFDGAPDVPYEKTIFETDTITVFEQGVTRPGCSLLQYLQKACKQGDSLTVKSERDGKFWRWTSISKYERQGDGRKLPTYEPLPKNHTTTGSEDFRPLPSWGE